MRGAALGVERRGCSGALTIGWPASPALQGDLHRRDARSRAAPRRKVRLLGVPWFWRLGSCKVEANLPLPASSCAQGAGGVPPGGAGPHAAVPGDAAGQAPHGAADRGAAPGPGQQRGGDWPQEIHRLPSSYPGSDVREPACLPAGQAAAARQHRTAWLGSAPAEDLCCWRFAGLS